MSRQSTLNVSLTAPLRKYVQSKVKSGGYGSASEVVREGLRALQARERTADLFWAEVRAKVAVARSQVEQGETVDGETAMDEIIGELDEHRPKPKRGRKSAR